MKNGIGNAAWQSARAKKNDPRDDGGLGRIGEHLGGSGGGENESDVASAQSIKMAARQNSGAA
jgi:hypothetical protein